MRSGVAALLAGCAAALAAVVLAAAGDERELAFSLHAESEGVLAVASLEREVCQVDVAVAGEFDTVELLLGTYGRPGPPVALSVRDAATGAPVARGVLPAGAGDNRAARVRVAPEVERGRLVDVCVRTAAHRVALYGDDESDLATTAVVGGRRVHGDLHMSFHRSRPRSALSLVPEIVRRAAVFRPGPIGPWAFWALLAAVGLGVPIMLAAALWRAVSRSGANGVDWRYAGSAQAGREGATKESVSLPPG